MAVAPNTIIQITDGTDTFEISTADDSVNTLDETGWAPPSPPYKTSVLGSRTLLENALETIAFYIHDTNMQDAYEQRQILGRLIFNAVRFKNRDYSVSPVLFKCIVQGSDPGKWLVAQLTGNAIQLAIPNDFAIRAAAMNDAHVTLSLERQGELVLESYLGENLAGRNSSFEEFDGADFPGWTRTSNPILARVTSTATFDGSYSAQIAYDGGGVSGIYKEISGLIPGVTYRASVYAINTGGGDWGSIQLSETGGTNPVSTDIPFPTSTRTRFSVTKVAPANGILRLSLLAESAVDTIIEVDAVLLEEDTGAAGTYTSLSVENERYGTSDSTTNALDVLVSTFPSDQTQSSLVEFTLAGYVNDQSTLRRSFLAIAAHANDIHLFTTGLGGTQSAASADNESGGQISTFSGTTTQRSNALTLPSTLRAHKVEVIIMARNSTGSAEVYASAWVHNPNSPSVAAPHNSGEESTQAAIIPQTSTESGGTPVIRPYYLGILQSHADIEAISLSFDGYNGGSFTLIVDTVLVINRDDDIHSRILVLEPSLDSWVYGQNAVGATLTLTLDPRTLTDRTPFFGFTKSDGTNEVEIPHRGDKNIRTIGDQIAACWMYSNGTKWAPVGTLTFTATRDLVYTTPV